MTGVKGAAIVALALPALGALLPLFVFVLGPPRALLHAAAGLAGAIVLLEALLVTYEKVPFTCTYVPAGNLKALGPIYAIAFFVGASTFAKMQASALGRDGPARVALTLAVLFIVLRVVSTTRRRMPSIDFEEAPSTMQRLGLYE